MAPSSNETDPRDRPSPSVQESQNGPDAPAEAPPVRDPNVTDPDPRIYVPYGSATDNPRIRALFENMQTRRAPPPVQSPITNGELAAAYASSLRAVPSRNPTPLPQPAVVVATLTPVPITPAPAPPPSPALVDAVTMQVPRPRATRRLKERRAVFVAAIAVSVFLPLAYAGIDGLRAGPASWPQPSAAVAKGPPNRPTLVADTSILPHEAALPPPAPPTIASVTPATSAPAMPTLGPATSSSRVPPKPAFERRPAPKPATPALSSHDLSDWFE